MKVDTVDTVKALAYKIARALQNKMPDKMIVVRTEYLPISGRIIVEYVLTEGGRIESCVAYSQSFFEDVDAEYVKWFATRIYVALKQYYEWNTRPGAVYDKCAGQQSWWDRDTQKTHARTKSEAGHSDDTVSSTSVRKVRRDKGVPRTRLANESHDDTDSKPVYAEDVPAGLF